MEELSALIEGEIVSIDGKTLRGSSCNSSKQKAIHMVSAWANENQVVLGQIKTDDKSNEIKDIDVLKNVTKEKDHRRIETRSYYLVNDISWLDNNEEWKNIKSIVMVERE